MREIKFRGKTIEGEWVYGYVAIHTIIGEETELKTVIVQKPDKIYQYDSWIVDPETIGQYTGLKDKNGNEIYEGDVIAYAESLDHEMYLESLDAPNEDYDEVHDEERGVAKIIYGIADDYPAFDLDEHNFDINGLSALVNYSYWYEIIGNIHDNTELLEV